MSKPAYTAVEEWPEPAETVEVASATPYVYVPTSTKQAQKAWERADTEISAAWYALEAISEDPRLPAVVQKRVETQMRRLTRAMEQLNIVDRYLDQQD